MMQLRTRDIFVLALVASLLVIVLVAIFTNLSGFHSVTGELHNAVTTVALGLWDGVRLVFFVFLSIGVLYAAGYGYVKFRHMNRFHVVGHTKHGPSQAVVLADGKVEHLTNTQIPVDTMQLIQMLQKSMQMNAAAANTTVNLMKKMEGVTVVEQSPADKQKLLGSPSSPELSIHLSKDYDVPADDFLSGRKLIVGVSGSGKSNTIGVYGEELGHLEVPFVLADTEDEYQPLCDSRWLRNGILAGATGMYSISVDNAEHFGHYVLDNLLQVVLNLQSYEMVEAAKIMIGIIKGMREWQEGLANEKRIPSDFILEEAVTWLPQYVNESPLKAQDPQTLAALQNTFFNDMVRKGRKRGLGITLVCQKIAELDNRAMQSDGKLLHRQAEEADLERYRKMGITREETLSLQNGEAFLFTGRVSKMRVQVRRRSSPHGANTPGLQQLRQHQIARNATKSETEIWGNFAEMPEKQANSYENFDQPDKPFHNISDFRKTEILPQKSPVREVPEMLRKEIVERYAEGMKRTDIRDDLQINGDQYWMVREVCDEYDRQRKAVQ